LPTKSSSCRESLGPGDGRGRQRKAFAHSLKEARALKAAKTTDVNRGEHRELSQETFATYAPKWIETYAGRTKRGLGSDTRDDYRKALERHAIPFLGRLRLSEIEPRDIKALAKEIADSGVSAGTVRLQLAPVKALLAEAFEEGLIRANPAAGVRIARPEQEQEEEVRPLAPEQLESLLQSYRTSGACSTSSLPRPGYGLARRSRCVAATSTSARGA
jgi:integrase